MIGVFDSGVGGLTALAELRELAPDADILYLADRKNAPYGTKSENELIELVTEDARRLLRAGARRILIACCTASTVYNCLPKSEARICVPIIEPAAEAAAKASKSGRIAVIATKRTVESHAFSNALRKLRTVNVDEYEAQELVSIVESGARDGYCTADTKLYLECLLKPVYDSGADTLILGCTHFPHLCREIQKILPNVNIISPSHEGALALLEGVSPKGTGRTIYL